MTFPSWSSQTSWVQSQKPFFLGESDSSFADTSPNSLPASSFMPFADLGNCHPLKFLSCQILLVLLPKYLCKLFLLWNTGPSDLMRVLSCNKLQPNWIQNNSTQESRTVPSPLSSVLSHKSPNSPDLAFLLPNYKSFRDCCCPGGTV